VRRDPHALGIAQTRWTLATIQEACAWMQALTKPGIAQILERLGISWKRARWHIHSPDPLYEAKLALVRCLGRAVRETDGTLVLVYLDEITIYRQPTLGAAWEQTGPHQARAERSYRSDTPTRVVATLDPCDGRVVYRRGATIGVAELVALYQDLVAAYPQAERMYAIQDNWPVHTHPDVLVALEVQETPWPYHRPASWSNEPSPKARQKYGDLHLPIQIVQLPTYASWTNPIEKLWRKLRGDLLHLHRYADRLEELQQEIDRFLDQFANGSQELLRYVGLLVPN